MTPRRSRRGLDESTVLPGVAPAGGEGERSDEAQRLRMRRVLLASLLGVLYLFVLALFSTQGLVDRLTLVEASVAVAVLVLGFYAIFATRVNLSFADPSLAGWQFAAAVAVMLFVVYRAPQARLAFTAFFFVAALFGMLRMSARRLSVLGGLATAAFALTIGLRYTADGDAATLRTDALLLAVVVLTFPWFVYIGEQVKRLERGLDAVSNELEDVEDAAVRDELTGVPNRRALNRALEEAKRRTDGSLDPFCVCILDLDHFKRFNDELGHLNGDEILKAFAREVQSAQRAGDVFGRYGGEEFVQILRGTDLDGAMGVAERLRVRIGALDLPGARFLGRLTVSIGVAQYRPREAVTSTLARADAALQRAKREGRNRVEC